MTLDTQVATSRAPAVVRGLDVVITTTGAARQRAAEEIARALEPPSPVLGLATGGTPEAVYALLAREGVRAGHARAFALDEYVGVAASDPRSYRSTLLALVAGPLGLPADHLFVPGGDGETAEEFEKRLNRAGGVDLQLLGIGTNGHIGFNEPGSSFASRTRTVSLAETTRRDNARFFTSVEDVPRVAMTQGIGTILEARRVMLLATGPAKADAVAKALHGPLDEECPASALRLHPSALIILDEAAAALL